ncbi:hypothetical protein D3C86_2245720 [compost metagenome]
MIIVGAVSMVVLIEKVSPVGKAPRYRGALGIGTQFGSMATQMLVSTMSFM